MRKYSNNERQVRKNSSVECLQYRLGRDNKEQLRDDDDDSNKTNTEHNTKIIKKSSRTRYKDN